MKTGLITEWRSYSSKPVEEGGKLVEPAKKGRVTLEPDDEGESLSLSLSLSLSRRTKKELAMASQAHVATDTIP